MTALPRHGTFLAGLDLGSTGVKILLTDDAGVELFVDQRPTPWRAGPGGTTDLDGHRLTAVLHDLLETASLQLQSLTGDPEAQVGALAISGMGETGFVVASDGHPVAPGQAWFDPRGQAQVDALPAALRTEFAGRTGLPVGVQVSVVKLLALRDGGLDLTGMRWFNLPEFVALTLGGRAVSDYTLASRTGLLDQDTGQPWVEMLDYLGVGHDFLPPLVESGTDLGPATADWVPAAFCGARIAVAGHDHLVSSVSGGAIADDRYLASIGTAEVLLRVIDEPLSAAARSRLADNLINCVRHVVPGQFVLVAGVKTGLLMRRALQLAGITDRQGRDRLDAEVLALGVGGALEDQAIEIAGARNDDGVLRVTVRSDGVSPAELFAAVLRHGNDEIRLLVDAMNREVPPARSTILTGGWADMQSVQRARAQVLPGVTVSQRSEDTSYGATMFAARLLTTTTPTKKEHHPVNELNTLERHALSKISTSGGHMLIVAADQRNSMKAVMKDAPNGPGSVTTEQLSDAKADIVTYLANHGPAILLDPETALPRIVDEGTLGRDTGLVLALDASGFESIDGLQYTRFIDGITPRRLRDLGADAAKMLWYMRPDKQGTESRVFSEIQALVQQCTDEGLLLIVEILVYKLEYETDEQFREAFPQLVIDSAALSVAAGAKVLKMQYPGSAEACAALHVAVDGVPWAVLSAGVDHSTFIDQVAIAVANGAAGAMAGRSLWKDSLTVDPDTREELLTTKALPRLRELETVVDGSAVPTHV